MAWTDQLRPASFRGVGFHVDASDATFGRRVVTHTYPLRDDAAHEDLGARPRAFSVEALVIGDDALAQAAALEAALIASGPGRLVHPWYGEFDAIVTEPARARHSMREGRVVRFQVTFERHGTNRFPSPAADTGAAAVRSADAVDAALIADFAAAFVTGGVPDFVIASAQSVLGILSSDMRGALGRGGLARSVAGGVLAALDGLGAATVQDLSDAVDIADRLIDATRQLAALTRPRSRQAIAPAAPLPEAATLPALAVIDMLIGVADAAPALPSIPTGTPSRRTEASNRDALAIVQRSGAATAAVRTAATATFDSHDQAAGYRDRLIETLEDLADELGAAGWDASWRAITDLRVAAGRDLTRKAGGLPRIATVRPPASTPSLALAHRLYGDDPAALFVRAADIVRRNDVRHPGFVPVADLEVLNG